MRDQKAWNWVNENNLAYDIWEKKYKHNNESFDEWIDRVSGRNKKIAKLVNDKKFLFGGRILSNRGVDSSKTKYTLSNCYVIEPPEDSIESIYECRKKLAKTFSYGGGCGIDISKLSPAGAKVHNQAKTTTGAVSFMEGFSKVAEEIGQNNRRGALMISIDCHHPDLLDFINVKTKDGAVTKANISVRITDDFMRAVEDDKMWEMWFYRPESRETITREMPAKELFRILCKNNWDWAEPGMLFWDNIENNNLLNNNEEFSYAGTNPCAEEPLPPGGSCLLGSINLSEFVKNPYTEQVYVDMPLIISAIKDIVEGLNVVLDEGVDLHPLEEQRKSVGEWRQIGLGIMGLADMLIKLGVPYGSKDSLIICEEIAANIAYAALFTSALLAKEYGPYIKYDNRVLKSKFLTTVLESEYIDDKSKEALLNMIETYGLRNSQLLTCAPTGSISLLAGTSNGIEPLFAKSWTRKTESLHGEDVFYKEYPNVITELMGTLELDDEEQLPDYVVISSEIKPIDRIAMQSVWQKYIDASISSTINLPKSATVEDVEEIYMNAWKYGLKGITIYRTGCKREGILTIDSSTDKEDATETETDIFDLPRGYIIQSSDDLIGTKRKLTTGCGTLHMEVYTEPETGAPMETFINIGGEGGCERNYQFISRLISLALRAGVPIESIIDQAESIRPCSAFMLRKKTKGDTSAGTSCPSAIGRALKELYQLTLDRVGVDEPKDVEAATDIVTSGALASCPECEDELQAILSDPMNASAICPECGSLMNYEGGCVVCKNCGYSKCD